MINYLLICMCLSILINAITAFVIYITLNKKIDEQLLKDKVTDLISESLEEAIERKIKKMHSSTIPAEMKNTVSRKKPIVSEEGKKRQKEALARYWAKKRATKAAALTAA